MELTGFPFFTDENIQNEVTEFLRNSGLDVKDVKEESLIGMGDKFLLELAEKEGRVFITHDSDFGRLVFIDSISFVGIIYLRPGHFDPEVTINSWKAIVNSELEIKVPFILVAQNTGESIKIRYRQL